MNPLAVIIATHAGDLDQARRLIRQILSFNTQGRFFLMTQKNLQSPDLLPAGWEWMTDWMEVKTAWSQGVSDASGPNTMWQQAAREACRLKIGPWLWLEPDCAPLRPDWLESLTHEYYRAKKPFMGGFAPKGTRMSGVAVYHEKTSQVAIKAMTARQVAFDMEGSDEFRQKGAHLTPLILDQFRCDPFKDQSDFVRRVPANAVLHHGDKTGSIYQFINGTRYQPEPEVIHMGEPAPVHFERIPAAADEITTMLNEKQQAAEKQLTVPEQIRHHLNAVVELVRENKPYRTLLYTELQRHGIEAGRKKRALPKKTAKAHNK